jgi:hypothetical protein
MKSVPLVRAFAALLAFTTLINVQEKSEEGAVRRVVADFAGAINRGDAKALTWRVSVLGVVLALVSLPSGASDQAPKQSTRHIPVVEDLVQLLQTRPDLRVALEGAIRTADLKGLRDMDSFLVYLDGFVTFVPTVDQAPTALKLYYIVNQPPGDQLNRDKSFSAWMNKLIEAWGQFLDTPASASGIPSFAARPNYMVLYRTKTGNPVTVLLPPKIADELRNVPPGPDAHPDYFFWSGKGRRNKAASTWQKAMRRMWLSQLPVMPTIHPESAHPAATPV